MKPTIAFSIPIRFSVMLFCFFVAVLLVSVPPAFAAPQLSSPPINEVVAYNLALAPSLDNSYDPSTANRTTITIILGGGAFTHDLSVSHNLDVAGLSLLEDNMTHPVPDLAIILTRGYSMAHLISIPVEGEGNFLCDRTFFEYISDETAWRCDFDGDYCAEYEDSSGMAYNANVTFSFRNDSISVPLESNISNVIPIPDTLLKAMEDSSGADNLTINISGELVFFYVMNDRHMGYGDECGSNLISFEKSMPLSINRSYAVAGTHKLFFLKAPVLREQWFRNNRFDGIVLSQSPLRHAEISLNGNLTSNLSLRTFEVVFGPHGLEIIQSNLSETVPAMESINLTTPIPLEQGNSSFAYIYRFNYSYDGLGENNLSLVVYDSFSGPEEFDRYDETLQSRMLSYGGKTLETGQPVQENPLTPSRGSIAVQLDPLLTLPALGLGFLVLLLIPVFNSWLRR